MTKQKDLKALVRLRMERNQESYTTARRHVVGKAGKTPAVSEDVDFPSFAEMREHKGNKGKALLDRISASLKNNRVHQNDVSDFWSEAASVLAKLLIAHLVAREIVPSTLTLAALLETIRHDCKSWVESRPVGLDLDLFGNTGIFGGTEVQENTSMTLLMALERIDAEGNEDLPKIISSCCPQCGQLVAMEKMAEHLAVCDFGLEPWQFGNFENVPELLRASTNAVVRELNAGHGVILFAHTGVGARVMIEGLSHPYPHLRTPTTVGFEGHPGFERDLAISPLRHSVRRERLGEFLDAASKVGDEHPILICVEPRGPVPTREDFLEVVRFCKDARSWPSKIQKGVRVIALEIFNGIDETAETRISWISPMEDLVRPSKASKTSGVH